MQITLQHWPEAIALARTFAPEKVPHMTCKLAQVFLQTVLQPEQHSN
jgi:hypothetical protein